MSSFAAQMQPIRFTPGVRSFRPALTPTPKVRRSPAHHILRPGTPQVVCQARVANIEIPNNKCIRYSLQYIFGVGDKTAQQILAATNVDPARRTYELSEDDLSSIRDEVEKYVVEGDLRRTVSLNIKRLQEIQCYRGKRHYNNLPSRGQNTKNNARTRKGKKQMAVAGKK